MPRTTTPGTALLIGMLALVMSLGCSPPVSRRNERLDRQRS
ncbi:MAG: hypothetical protein ACUVSW_19230 [Roseiflexus sp.]